MILSLYIGVILTRSVYHANCYIIFIFFISLWISFNSVEKVFLKPKWYIAAAKFARDYAISECLNLLFIYLVM